MAKTRKSKKESAGFRLFGIFGYPLAHTLSPAMQEAAFAAAGVKAFYGAFELERGQFHRALKNPKSLTLEGFNITVPYKREVMKHLDTVLPEAKVVGAVNTAFRRGAKWTGANTDVNGFLLSLKHEGHFSPRGKNILIFGAGGAARAVLYGLSKSGAKQIVVMNRHEARAKKLIREFQNQFPKTIFASGGEACCEIEEADLIVNATSLGLKKTDAAVVPATLIPRADKKQKLFFDLIYHTPQTAFLKAAKQKGHRALGGLGMLLFQGAEAFQLWTGKKAPVSVMRRALVEALEQKGKA
jgi:shikimate dehydrogenase